MTERSGVEIDFCPTCRGVWLDRGELDKIIERSGPAVPARADDDRRDDRRDRDRYDDRDRYRDDDHKRKKKRRESFLEDLFDF
jgi:Zn-finger nucleic acid-binding protein